MHTNFATVVKQKTYEEINIFISEIKNNCSGGGAKNLFDKFIAKPLCQSCYVALAESFLDHLSRNFLPPLLWSLFES